jgi:hypothetical protein
MQYVNARHVYSRIHECYTVFATQSSSGVRCVRGGGGGGQGSDICLTGHIIDNGQGRDPGSFRQAAIQAKHNTSHHTQINTYYEYQSFALSFSHNSILWYLLLSTNVLAWSCSQKFGFSTLSISWLPRTVLSLRRLYLYKHLQLYCRTNAAIVLHA